MNPEYQVCPLSSKLLPTSNFHFNRFSLSMSVTFIDDADTTALTYSGVWNFSSYAEYYNQTVHVANSTTVSKATCIFTGMSLFIPNPGNESLDMKYILTGITIRVFGVAVNILSSYTIDGGNTTFPNATRSGPGPNYDILLYTSPILLDGQHNLTIDANNLLIDYFLVTTPGETSSSASLISSVSAQPTGSPMELAKTSKSAHQKPIIGAVVAVATVAILVVFYLWLRHRRKNVDNKSACQSFNKNSLFCISSSLL